MKEDVCCSCQNEFETALTIWYDLKVGAYRVDIDQERVLRIATTPVPVPGPHDMFLTSMKYRLYGQYPLPIPPRYVCRIRKEKS